MERLNKCPNCGAKLRSYISKVVRRVCVNKCQGWNPAQSKRLRDKTWTKGDLSEQTLYINSKGGGLDDNTR